MDQDKYIGRLLDNRYEIQEVLGVGGMAVVYKARCHRLNRLVAIKILKDEHAQDEEFRRRFHAESQAVAMLSHPNIVSIYDVSSTGDANYIVMELIDGISLKQYMEKKGILNWKETLHFAIQIGKALEHAHSRGIVHRDIKPHNVMVLKNGSVKVTDFGIARVMTKSNTLTKEALGSVHYISPEQAKGGRVDSRSDLYSLGVVMYEMITGRPPYDGESPVSVAIQHINGGAKMPSLLNPQIPGGLEQIIMKAMAHDPSGRYDNATTMLYEMDEFRKDPTMLFDYNSSAQEDVTHLQPTPLIVTNPGNQTQKTTAERVAGKKEQARTDRRSAPRRTGVDRTEERGTTFGRSQERGQSSARRRREEEERRNQVTTIAVISCSLVVILAIGIMLWMVINGGLFAPRPDALITVPYLIGSDYDTLDKDSYQGLQIVLQARENSDEFPEGQIMTQEPAADTKVVEGTKIKVVVSLGPDKIMDEDLVGLELENAKNWLLGQGVPENLILTREEYSSNLLKGKVTRTDPAYGEEIVEGKTVTIWVGLGPEIINARMPNVVGKQYADALAELNHAGFMDVTPEEVESNEPAGTVLKQSHERYISTDVTTPIILTVSKGPEQKVMPNVVGKAYADAERQLLDMGFLTVNAVEVESNEPAGTVLEQSVEDGTMIEVTTSIELKVSLGPKMVEMPDLTNKTFEEAETLLLDMGFTVVNRTDVENEADAGTVIGQSVEKNAEVPVTTVIELTVSKGPKIVKMPDLTNKTYEEAEALLLIMGFKIVDRTDVEDDAAPGIVIGQSVEKDTEVPVTTVIQLTVSKGPAVPVLVKKTITVNLRILFMDEMGNPLPTPVTPYRFELRDAEGEVVTVLDACDQITFTLELEGYGLQTYEIYVDELFFDYLTVDFRVSE